MYLHLGQGVVVRQDCIVGIFDLDNASSSYITREFLSSAEKKKRVVSITEELPKSFVLCAEKDGFTVYLSQLASKTLGGRGQITDNRYGTQIP